MKEFRDLCLCSFRNEQVSVFVSADLIGGKLTIKGDDVRLWKRGSETAIWNTGTHSVQRKQINCSGH